MDTEKSYQIQFSTGQKIIYFIFGILSFRQAFKGEPLYLSPNDIQKISTFKNDNVVINLKISSPVKVDFFSISKKLNSRLIEENQSLIKSPGLFLLGFNVLIFILAIVGIPLIFLFSFFALPVESLFNSPACDSSCSEMIVIIFAPAFSLTIFWLSVPALAYVFQKLSPRFFQKRFSYPNMPIFIFVMMGLSSIPVFEASLTNPRSNNIISHWKKGTLSAKKVSELQAEMKKAADAERFKTKMADSKSSETF